MNEEGYVYVDVRSLPEFDNGHPEGAYNVPFMHMTPQGMQPNLDFMNVMEANFEKDAKIVVGCRSGGRSLRAAEALRNAGYQNVIDQRAGFVGGTDQHGAPEQGWQPKNLPVSNKATAGHSYEDLAQKAGKG